MNFSLALRAQAGRPTHLTGTKATVGLPSLQPVPIHRSNWRSRALAGNNNTPSSDAPQPTLPQTRIIGSTMSSIRSRREPTELETTPQHFGGALTTLIFGAALLSERLNGVGIVQNLELHNKGFHPVLLASIVVLLCASAWPEKQERNNPSVLVRIQMAGARVAYLGLAGAIAAEMFTGKGILTLLDFETGVEVVSDIEAVLAFAVMLFLTGPQSGASQTKK